MSAYYNEIDPFAAQWLRNLIDMGLIAPGDVDTRSIEDVQPDDIRGYTQCHFFAGIGVWSYALRSAGWGDTWPVWTGSCPCQPFSTAGKGSGFADERHLWPALDHLIGECHPGTVFGEQVASPDGLAWLDLVRPDMEAKNYAFGAFDLCAAGVGAPHIRQRLFWVGDTLSAGLEGHAWDGDHGHQPGREQASAHRPIAASGVSVRRVCLTDRDGREAGLPSAEAAGHGGAPDTTGRTRGAWESADWLPFRDGKWRPVEPGTLPVAHGTPTTVGELRAYGNAIVAPLAEEFIRAYLSLQLQ